MILFDSVTYYKLESKDLVDLKCDTCSTVYQKTKRDFYYSAYNRKTKRINFKIKNYCSKKCIEISYDINKKTHKCLECATEFVARITDNQKFCSHSCAASYNNKKRDRNKTVNCYDCNKSFLVWKCRTQNYFRCNECVVINKNTIKEKNIKIKQTPEPKILKCKICSNEFQTVTNRIYCTDKCRHEAYKKYEHICQGCNKNFKSSEKNSKFCSNSCKSISLNLSVYAHKAGGKSRSKIELFLEDKLKNDFPNLKMDFNQTTAIGSELDIYIPELKIAIELNGIIHYEPIYGEATLIRTQKNDKKKMITCQEYGIELIVINMGNKGLTKALKNEIYEKVYSIIERNK